MTRRENGSAIPSMEIDSWLQTLQDKEPYDLFLKQWNLI